MIVTGESCVCSSPFLSKYGTPSVIILAERSLTYFLFANVVLSSSKIPLPVIALGALFVVFVQYSYDPLTIIVPPAPV